MTTFEIRSYAATFRDGGGASIAITEAGPKEPRRFVASDLGEVRFAVHTYLCQMQEAGITEAVASVRLVSGRAPRGFRAWEKSHPWLPVKTGETVEG